jgi:acyl-coenzyme A synthetase/AMP-(fatty) acid ligase
LPSASRPREFRRVTQLPRNAMGKLLRAELAPLLR